MAKPLSLDLRVRIAEGLTVRAAAKRFDVSAASAVRVGRLARSGQGLAARRMGGHRACVLVPVRDALAERLARKTDWTVKAMAADLNAAGITVSQDTVWCFVRRQRLSLKITPTASETGHPRLAELRAC
jgi:transposase